MIIVGAAGKPDSEKRSLIDFQIDKTWKNIFFKNKSIYLDVYCKADKNIRIVDDRDKLLIMDDKLFIFENGLLRTADDAALNNIYKEKSADFIKNVNSNFDLFLYDKIRDKTYLASNRLTAGRMHYLFWKDALFFSNDFALLLNFKDFSLNRLALYGYLKFGAVPEDITFDEAIKTVPVSHYAEIDRCNKTARYIPFFKFNHTNSASDKVDEKLLSLTEETLKVNAKALSDKRVHIFISGGIDSSLFAFYLREYTSDIVGHYCCFGYDDPEQRYAEEVVKKLGIPLEIHTLGDDSIIAEIEDTAANTSCPHGDYSNISVNFLIREIIKEYGAGSLIVDCNGGDDGFGYLLLSKIPKLKVLHKAPAGILKILGNFATIGNTWMYDSGIKEKALFLHAAREKNLYISHMIYSLADKVFNDSDGYDGELKKLITTFFNNNIESRFPCEYEQMNVAQFLHINSREWTAKAYSPANRMGGKVVYPYTWRNVVDVQSEIPLSMKIFDNKIKFPLKKLLEKYMPESFIYREKSGFRPPLYRWLKIDKNYGYAYRTIMKGSAINRIKKDKIEKIFGLIKSGRRLSPYTLNLIWALLFFEVWLKTNCKKRKSQTEA